MSIVRSSSGRRPAAARAAAAAAASAVLLAALGTTPAVAQDDYRILVVGETLGFRHSHIDDTTRALIGLGAEHGFSVDVWDPPNDSSGWWGPGSPGQPELTLPSSPFTTARNLSRYATIVFVSPVDNTNSLDPSVPRLLDDREVTALKGYVHRGGGVVGLHAATDTMHTVPWFTELIGGGARFVNHPQQQTATMLNESPAHPSMRGVPLVWERWDEWYNFSLNPRGDVHVLMTLDESTYQGGTMGDDHPIAWCQNFEGGRSWYEGAGHVDEAWSDPVFLRHVLGGIEWTAGEVSGGGNCVTWSEVQGIVEDLPDDSRRERAVERLITWRLDAAEAAADAGDHARAVRILKPLALVVRAVVRDDDTARLLSSKIRDLADWQRGLRDAGL